MCGVMTDDLVERVAWLYENKWGVKDYGLARAALRIALEEAARLFDPPDECDCSVCQDRREQAAAIRAMIA